MKDWSLRCKSQDGESEYLIVITAGTYPAAKTAAEDQGYIVVEEPDRTPLPLPDPMGWAGALVAYLVGFVVMRAFATGGTMGFIVGAIGAIGIDVLGILWARNGLRGNGCFVTAASAGAIVIGFLSVCGITMMLAMVLYP